MITAIVDPDAPETSQFTVRDLLSLANPQRAYLSPLAVIAHIDANAFFAQVEQIRLGLSRDDPVVCVQWSTLIAVSYAAREYGIGRMDNLESAKLKCDKLVVAHTAVFRKGENFWRYHDEAKELPSPVDHKVSLDPYRRESRKIMKLFKQQCDLCEKASVDESFMDLGRNVLQRLEDLIPGFVKSCEGMGKTDHLPPVPRDIKLNIPQPGIVVPTSNEEENKPMIRDWDDILIMLGGIITFEMRQRIEKELGYTTSCGVAKVKTVAKLASGFKKPDNQTIVRNSSIFNFLKNFDFTDFWSMGGKTGDYIKLKLTPPASDSMAYIREHYDLHELEDHLEDKQLAEKLYLMVRGEFAAPLSERIVLKSMNANKNIRGNSGSSFKDACEWIKVFAADLVQRLVETDDENGYKTRAKTISVHFRSKKAFNTTHSKQSSLPIVPIDELEETFYKYGTNLLKACEAQYGEIYPLVNLNMTISNFELSDGLTSSIMGFVKKGDASAAHAAFEKLEKAEKVDTVEQMKLKEVEEAPKYSNLGERNFKCLRCGTEVQNAAEHDDFHYAIEMAEQLNGSSSLSSDLRRFSSKKMSYAESMLKARSSSPAPSSSGSGTKRAQSRGGPKDKKLKMGKGQSRLPF